MTALTSDLSRMTVVTNASVRRLILQLTKYEIMLLTAELGWIAILFGLFAIGCLLAFIHDNFIKYRRRK